MFWPIFVDGLVFFLFPATKTPYFLAGTVISLTSAINTAIFLARSALPAPNERPIFDGSQIHCVYNSARSIQVSLCLHFICDNWHTAETSPIFRHEVRIIINEYNKFKDTAIPLANHNDDHQEEIENTYGDCLIIYEYLAGIVSWYD